MGTAQDAIGAGDCFAKERLLLVWLRAETGDRDCGASVFRIGNVGVSGAFGRAVAREFDHR